MSAGNRPEVWPRDGAFGVEQCGGRAGGAEDAGKGSHDPPEGQPRRRRGRIEGGQLRGGLGRGHRGRAAAAVDVDQSGQVVGTGVAVEVPGGVRRHHRAAQRVAAEDHLAAQLLGRPDDPVQVLDGDGHAPLLGEVHGGVGDRLEVRLDGGVLQVAEVVVEQLGRVRPARLERVQGRLVLEQVLAALDRPHLPARGLGHHPPGQGHEVGAPGRCSRLEDQHVPGPGRTDLEDAHPVVPGRGARGGEARHPGHGQR